MNFLTFCISVFTFLIMSCCVQINDNIIDSSNHTVMSNSSENYSQVSILNRIENKKNEALEYCKFKQLNTKICFLVDMKIHSGKKRFFVYDFVKDTTIKSGLVAHGCGLNYRSNDKSKDEPMFSNVPESHLSSLGKYKVGKRGWSNWGIHVNYRIHGLDTTNNNANKRDIVLHSWNLMTDNEIYPEKSVESWGCPAVSNQFMKYLDSMLIKQNQPVLLWIYY